MSSPPAPPSPGPVRWSLGRVSLMHVRANAASQHCSRPPEHSTSQDVSITFACRPDAPFSAGGARSYGGNQFVIAPSDAACAFGDKDCTELWVLAMPLGLLKQRLRGLDRYMTRVFDAETGVRGLLCDTLRLLPRRLREADPAMCESLGVYLVDLLAMAVESDEGLQDSLAPSVRTAHLVRIHRFIRQNLATRALSPQMIATHCDISVRYLHELFADNGPSVSRWIRELRLAACEQQLRDGRGESIAEIAYRWGFGDQAQFSRHFRAQFGCTPSERRNRPPPG